MAISHRVLNKQGKNASKQITPTVPVVDPGIARGDDPDDIWNKIRTSCKLAVSKTFHTFISKNEDIKLVEPIDQLSKKYEQALYKKNSYSLNAYKLRFRKDITALKNSKATFTLEILTGVLNINDFVNFDELDLVSRNQKRKNIKYLDEELKNKMGKQFPTNINQIKNQNVFVGEKWGISESAAKIDPEFEFE